MQSTTRVALDAMGGDNAPAEVVKGAVDAVNKRNDINSEIPKGWIKGYIRYDKNKTKNNS